MASPHDVAMSHEPPHDSPPEAELDDVLSQATTLASSLKEEIGETGGRAESAAPDPMTEVKTSTSDTVECELRELERLVASASEEVGANVTDAAPGGSTPPTDAADDTALPESPAASVPETAKPRSVPDFMSEFTAAEAPPEVKEPARFPRSETVETARVADSTKTGAGAGAARATRPGVVGTSTLQTGHAPPDDVADERCERPESDTERSEPGARKATAGDALRAFVQRLAPVGFALCAKGVGLLESIDRPLGRIGAAPRILLGWLAVATLGTASIVYLVSLW